MKRILSLILAILMLVTCLVACDTTPQGDGKDSDTSAPDITESENTNTSEIPAVDPSAATLFVGYGRECITPTEEMQPNLALAGYAEGRPIEAIESQLYVSCTAFKDAEGDIALIYTIDLHALSPAQFTALASEITRATKVPKSHIIINVTHNHAAPGTGANDAYWDYIKKAIVTSGETAIADLKACTELYAGEVNMKYYSFVRRYIEEDGKPVAHISEGDPMVPVARFVRDGGKDVILVNFAAHCDTVSGRAWTTLSADYVDSFRRVVEHELDAHFSMQLGATGDLNPMTRISDEPSFYGSTSNYGKNLGYKILEELKTLPQLEIKGDVEAKSSTARVEVDHSTDHLLEEAQEVNSLYYGAEDKGPAEEKMKEYGILSIYEAMYIVSRASRGEYERRNVSAISIGNIIFAAADYEMLSATGRHVKDAGNENFDLTFMCAYSNGMIGYIPDDHTFNYYVYEVYSCPYVRGSAEIIEAKIIELMAELAAK